MAKKRHPRHPKERNILKAIRRTPPVIGGEELPTTRKQVAPKRARKTRKKR
jgi:hypothetical protein